MEYVFREMLMVKCWNEDLFLKWKNDSKMVLVSSRAVHHRLHRGRVRPLRPVLRVLDLQGQDPG